MLFSFASGSLLYNYICVRELRQINKVKAPFIFHTSNNKGGLTLYRAQCNYAYFFHETRFHI
jgi:hypothetical protein